MEKDIGKIQKSTDTDIVIRIDDFGGRVGLTIREFVRSERYSGFTKAGTRIPADKVKQFKELISSIDENELEKLAAQAAPATSAAAPASTAPAEQKTLNNKQTQADKKQSKAKPASAEGIEEQEF